MATLGVFRAIVEVGKGTGRPAGSDAETSSRKICARALEAQGFTVIERLFEFSAWPGRRALPLAGLLLVIGGAIAWMGAAFGQIDFPLTVGSVLLTLAVVGGAFIGEFGPTSMRRSRCTSINLEATRGTPAVWLVAHLDTKSQTIPMLLRIAAVIVCGLAWSLLLTFWSVTLVFPIPPSFFTPFALTAMLSAIPLALTFVRNTSTGALDNASGVATLLDAVARLHPTLPIGVLITSAEELGLAGARAWVVGKPPGVAINIDSIDDSGPIICMVARTDRSRFSHPVGQAARASGVPVALRGIIPGILVDAVAFSSARWPSLTVSRGTLRSLARIHTARDDLHHMTGTGIGTTAQFVANLVGAIIVRREE
jgi:hypothetical protein